MKRRREGSMRRRGKKESEVGICLKRDGREGGRERRVSWVEGKKGYKKREGKKM